jgi:hypothetical protein
VVIVLLVKDEQLSSIVVGTRENGAVSLPGPSSSPNGGKKGFDDPRLTNVRGAVDIKPDGDGAGNTTKNDGVVLGFEPIEKKSRVGKYAKERSTSFVRKDGLAVEQVFVKTQLGNGLRDGKSNNMRDVAGPEEGAKGKDVVAKSDNLEFVGVSALGVAGPGFNETGKDMAELFVDPFKSLGYRNDPGKGPQEVNEKRGRSAYEMFIGGGKESGKETGASLSFGLIAANPPRKYGSGEMVGGHNPLANLFSEKSG